MGCWYSWEGQPGSQGSGAGEGDSFGEAESGTRRICHSGLGAQTWLPESVALQRASDVSGKPDSGERGQLVRTGLAKSLTVRSVVVFFFFFFFGGPPLSSQINT